MTKESDRRADAVQNRERILAVARNALRDSTDVSMHTIAKLAGVGQGTLYRNFPNRDALILELHRQDVGSLVVAAEKLVELHPPVDALREWILEMASFGQRSDGLSQVLRGFSCDQLRTDSFKPAIDTLSSLLQRAQISGAIRPGIDGDDLLDLVGFIWTTGSEPERTRRLLNILMTGLALPTTDI